MAQTIRFMSKATGVTPAADNAAATLQPDQGSSPAKTVQQVGVPIVERSDITLTAATDPVATGDIYVAVCLPVNNEIIDGMVELSDVDSGAALTVTLAQLTKDFTDIVAGTELIIATTAGQAGGVARASNVPGMMLAASATEDRWYGLKIVAGAAGLNAGALMRAVIMYRAV
jgi:hypothetical protein